MGRRWHRGYLVGFRRQKDSASSECDHRDNHQRLCFTLALWNGKDNILKERLYGLNGNQGKPRRDPSSLAHSRQEIMVRM